MAVIDAFLFFQELDVLELRLHTLKDKVDKFVLVESAYTFANHPKPLHFAENRGRFAPFLDRIVHVAHPLPFPSEDRWANESLSRGFIDGALAGFAQPDDLILVSDVDEIPQEIGKIGAYELDTRYYKAMWRLGWQGRGTCAVRYRDYPGAQALRDQRPHLPKAGTAWHFSYMGGVDRIVNKIHAFAHAEYDDPFYTDKARLLHAIQSRADLFGRPYALVDVGSQGLPAYLTPERFPDWF